MTFNDVLMMLLKWRTLQAKSSFERQGSFFKTTQGRIGLEWFQFLLPILTRVVSKSTPKRKFYYAKFRLNLHYSFQFFIYFQNTFYIFSISKDCKYSYRYLKMTNIYFQWNNVNYLCFGEYKRQMVNSGILYFKIIFYHNLYFKVYFYFCSFRYKEK